MNRDDASAAVVAVALGAIALCVEVGSATAYAAYMHKDVAAFIAAHPFDILSVAVWYSAGNWLARHIRSVLSLVVLSYGLATSGLVALLAQDASFISAVELAIGAGTAVAIAVSLVLLLLGEGGGGPPPGGRRFAPDWMSWGEALWAMVLISAGAVYFEYSQPKYWLADFVPLALAAAAALVLGRIIVNHGLSQGPYGAAVVRLGPKAPAADIGVAQLVPINAGDEAVTAPAPEWGANA